MSLFVDMFQSLHIDETADRATSLEERVARLEKQLATTTRVLRDVIHVLEVQSQKDIDGNGRIG